MPDAFRLSTSVFSHARAANEHATLLINDYRVDPAYVQLIKDMTQQAGHRPFDVIGLQSHMHGGVWTNEKIWEVCERFAPFDVPLHFTELTVLSGAVRLGTGQGRQAVAVDPRRGGSAGEGRGPHLHDAVLPSGGGCHHLVGLRRPKRLATGPGGTRGSRPDDPNRLILHSRIWSSINGGLARS